MVWSESCPLNEWCVVPLLPLVHAKVWSEGRGLLSPTPPSSNWFKLKFIFYGIKVSSFIYTKDNS